MIKQLSKLGLIAWIAVAVCLIPYREAKAELLGMIIGLVTIGALGGASYCEVAGCFTPITGASVAQAVGASGVQRLDATLSDGTKLRTQLTKEGGKVPAPDVPATQTPTGGTTGGILASDQSTKAFKCTKGLYTGWPASCGVMVSVAECTAWASVPHSSPRGCKTADDGGNASGNFYYSPVDGTSGEIADCPVGTISCNNLLAKPGSGCPAGYTFNGSDLCNVSDARLAKPDGNVDLYINEDGGLSFYSDADTVPDNVQLADGGAKIWGKDSEGKPFVAEIKPTSDGGATIKTQSQGSGGYVNDSTIKVGGDGTIQSVGESSAPGSISAPAGGGAPVVGVTGTAQAVQFPSDYAKTGEAAGAADKINAKLDKLNEALTKPGEPLADPTAPDGSEFSDGFFSGTFDSITSWRMPGHSSQCPTADLSFNAWGSYWDLNFVSHCQILESPKVQPVAEVSFVVLWLIVALFIVLGA